MMKSVRYAAAILGLAAVGTLFFGSTPASAQQSNQPCINACRQANRDCLAGARNPGDRNQCRKAFEACLATCQ